jgi:UDP-N-acetylbacillosamine N-acetyltransferase
MKKKIFIIGVGSHSKTTAYILKSYGFSVIRLKYKSKNLYLKNKIFEFKNKPKNKYFIAIGNIKLRYEIFKYFKKKLNFVNVISKSSNIITKSSLKGNNIFIGHNTLINNNAKIYSNTIINSGSIIEHDVEIDEDCNISPGVIICGNTKIGKKTFVGAGTVIIDKIKIQKEKKIGSLSNIKK